MNKKGHWYTDKNGNHYFVEEGQTAKEGWEASKRRKMISDGKYQVSNDGENWEETDEKTWKEYEADYNDFDLNDENDFNVDEELDIETLQKDLGLRTDKDFDKEKFIENIDEIDYDKAEKNESKNAIKGKNENRKDEYGNPLVSDEAFKVGQEGAKAYIDYMTKYHDLDKLKNSNIFLGGIQSAINKAIIEAGYNPNLDTTYQDLNEIAGSVLGEEVSFEDYERNATKGFTGKKYNGYVPGKKEETIDYENIEYPKGTSKEYSMMVNNKYEKALPILEKTGIKLSDFGGKPSEEGGYEDNSREIMDKYVFEPFRQKYPKGNNEVWEKEYQPIYDAIEAVLDKNYNDWYIKNKK